MEKRRLDDFHIRAINPLSAAEIDLVAQRMRATLIEVEREDTGTALYSMDWLRERVRWHLDSAQVAACVFLAEDNSGVILGHTIIRREFEQDGREYGLISTTYVIPESRRLGVADALLRAGEEWMRSLGLGSCATWTSSTNLKLIRMYEKHGYRQTTTHVHETTGTIMVKLERNL
jgi:GNAT superfamily N-acetyltransferase